MGPKISIFTLVGQVIMRILVDDVVLHVELDPLEAWLIAGQLDRAANGASKLGREAPEDLKRTAPLSLPPGEEK